MGSQSEFNFDEVTATGPTKGALRFLREYRREFLKKYINYPLHIRINMKANNPIGKGLVFYRNRHNIFLDWRERKKANGLDEYYAHVRLNRRDVLNYVGFSDHKLFETHSKRRPADRSKNVVYAIIMKTVGDKQKRYALIDKYIQTGSYAGKQLKIT